MFPARAGMSRVSPGSYFVRSHVPRASGDEPEWSVILDFEGSCSPRERG